ncbi:Protein of uncharacterised function (DUF2958) [Klebsiella pneumoniae]|uniref:Protein of uncharacterized function (DUF2958) n=1 Tax=Klebsiella pneumoniae TaxID=573 RepID=A0A378A049_KLEPN|nr:Protein of uncharacterised function (DUF2958) [Klebsiella pneumoniae]
MNNALITDEQRIVLLANGRESLENPDFDPAPVVKLFTPDDGATWLLTEIDPDDHDHAFGLCDLGLGMPEIGWVSLGELATVRGGLGLPIERDLSFRAEKRLRLMRAMRGWPGGSLSNPAWANGPAAHPISGCALLHRQRGQSSLRTLQ